MAPNNTVAPNDSDVPTDSGVLWRPADARRPSAFAALRSWLDRERGLTFVDYEAFLRWSIDEHSAFWSLLWEYFDLPGHGHVALAEDQAGQVFRPKWFEGAVLNYAETMLRMPGCAPEQTALIGYSHSRETISLTVTELRDTVARLRTGLLDLGVGRGDRVAAYLPNVPEAVALMLATTALGAVFTSCPPEFGVQSVIDRWRQIEPKVVVAVDGYRHGDKRIERSADVGSIIAALPSVEHVVLLPYLDGAPPVEAATQTWEQLRTRCAPMEFERVPFDHPLYILFSSGTTGLPKAIVHGHGGMTLEHLKSLSLAHDVQSGDRVFWQTTTGWMMWNLVVSGLGLGAAVVVSDLSPTYPDVGVLWRMAAAEGITHFGTSPGFLQLCRKAGYVPREHVDTSRIMQLGVTGAACSAELAAWACASISDDVRLMAGSGGTDICSGFVGDSADQVVRTGRMASAYPGVALAAYNEAGESIVGQQGELVITKPLPSMPVAFWGDADEKRYRAAYFEDFPGVWRHGDWVTVWPDGSCAIFGRSDATLNRDGVRLGTAEYYDLIDRIDGIRDALVVHVEPEPGAGGRLLLFVVTEVETRCDADLVRRLRAAIKQNLSPRHLPDEVHAIDEVPRNLVGKRLEVPVKKILEGAKVADVAAPGALQNAGSLDVFVAFAVQP